MKHNKIITFRIDQVNFDKIKSKGYTKLIRTKILEYLTSIENNNKIE